MGKRGKEGYVIMEYGDMSKWEKEGIRGENKVSYDVSRTGTFKIENNVFVKVTTCYCYEGYLIKLLCALNLEVGCFCFAGLFRVLMSLSTKN